MDKSDVKKIIELINSRKNGSLKAVNDWLKEGDVEVSFKNISKIDFIRMEREDAIFKVLQCFSSMVVVVVVFFMTLLSILYGLFGWIFLLIEPYIKFLDFDPKKIIFTTTSFLILIFFYKRGIFSISGCHEKGNAYYYIMKTSVFHNGNEKYVNKKLNVILSYSYNNKLSEISIYSDDIEIYE